jgi:hypothetical protein
MITLAIIDTEHPNEIIKEVSPQDLASEIWNVSKIRHAMFIPVEISDLCANAIINYIDKIVTENKDPKLKSMSNYARSKVEVLRILDKN